MYAIFTSGIDVKTFIPHDNCILEKFINCNPPDEEDPEYELYYNNMWGDNTYYKFYDHIKENIQKYENFLVFMYGVCIPRPHSILNKYDFFHSIYFLKSIADFTGIIISDNDYHIYKSVSQMLDLS